MKIIIDTETTGLPMKDASNNFYSYKDISKYDNARLLQLAYIIYDESLKHEIKRQNFIVKPTFTFIPCPYNNITQDIIDKEGISVQKILDTFYSDLKQCDTVIAHNLKFDKSIICAESYRLYNTELINELDTKKSYCTMLKGQEYTINKFGITKWPKLIQLYSIFYPEKKWIQIHDAMDDVEKCLECYLALRKSDLDDIISKNIGVNAYDVIKILQDKNYPYVLIQNGLSDELDKDINGRVVVIYNDEDKTVKIFAN